jgi:hypothetical protein
MWAVLLGVVLMLAAATGSHAAVLAAAPGSHAAVLAAHHAAILAGVGSP